MNYGHRHRAADGRTVETVSSKRSQTPDERMKTMNLMMLMVTLGMGSNSLSEIDNTAEKGVGS